MHSGRNKSDDAAASTLQHPEDIEAFKQCGALGRLVAPRQDRPCSCAQQKLMLGSIGRTCSSPPTQQFKLRSHMSDPDIHYHLTALDEFQCLAENCPASCCSGWRIPVETELVARWAEFTNEHDRHLFLSAVQKEQHADATALCMTSGAKLRCGLLTPEGLCQAHARYGVDYTPLACQAFPKMQEQTTLVRMQSASTACPVIARRLVTAGATEPLFRTHSAPPQLHPLGERDRLCLAWVKHFDRLMAADTFPIGVRLYYLAASLSQPQPAMATKDTVTDIPEKILRRTLEQALDKIAKRAAQRRLKPDPVVAGSFWNTLYRLGQIRELWPEWPAKHSALTHELPRLAADRRRHYADIYREIAGLRGRTRPAWQHWHRRDANRLLHVLLVNTGFPWQPSLENYAFSFVHGMILFALTSLRLWMVAATGARIDAGALSECVYRTGRAFGHNTLIPAQIQANPALLDLHRYHSAFLDL